MARPIELQEVTDMSAGEAVTELGTSIRAWYGLAVLTLLLILGLVDRFVLSLLVDPVRRDLGISDGQMGLLIGASFALFYSLAGLPAGYLVDRFNRRNLLLSGALIWTMMTFASAFAPSFTWLFIFRAGVGIGEAVLSPAIYSIIRDSIAPRHRPLAFGIHNMGSPLGTGTAMIVVGHLSGWALAGAFDHIPVIGGLGEWRTVLALVGMIGIPIALMVLTIREPARGDSVGKEAEATVNAVWRHFKANLAAYIAIFLSTGFYGIGLNGFLAWVPTALARAWEVPASSVGPTIGSIQVIAAPAGLIFSGLILTWVSKRGKQRLVPIFGAAALSLAAVMLVGWSQADKPSTAWTMLCILLFLTPWSGVCIATLLARITPGRMMGKIAAVNFLMLGLVGMIFGPTLNPFLAETFFSGPGAMMNGIGLGSGTAMALSAAMLGAAGIATWQSE